MLKALLILCLLFYLLELREKQSLENAQLMREKAVIENDLLKTQVGQKAVIKLGLQWFEIVMITVYQKI